MPFKTTSNDGSPSIFGLLVVLALCVTLYLGLQLHPALDFCLILVGGAMVLMVCASCITRLMAKRGDGALITLSPIEGVCPGTADGRHRTSDGVRRSTCAVCGVIPHI